MVGESSNCELLEDLSPAPKKIKTSDYDLDLGGDSDEAVRNEALARSNLQVSEPCGKCGLSVPVWEAQEHRDYHLAVELQEQDRAPQSSRTSKRGAGSMDKFVIMKR